MLTWLLRLLFVFPHTSSSPSTADYLPLLTDIWVHVDKLSSAHVYLRLPELPSSGGKPSWGESWESIPEKLLTDLGQLVKANSIEGNKRNNVTIIYTPHSNLKVRRPIALLLLCSNSFTVHRGRPRLTLHSGLRRKRGTWPREPSHSSTTSSSSASTSPHARTRSSIG